MKIIKENEVYLGFDLSQYCHPFALKYLAMLAITFPNQVIFSAGLRYKTDLTAFGGDGYRMFQGDASQSWLL